MIRRIQSIAALIAGQAKARMALPSLLLFATVFPGCAVPQRPGAGQELLLQEPKTKAWYWLYLPKGYKESAAAQGEASPASGRYPLVMTFHGMKPFDDAEAQSSEWQQEADRYGYVVCAPELHTPDLFSPLPLKRVTGSLRDDEQAILAIMDEIMRTVDVDPNAVLATCWSYGGYIAHYMMNRHPERFTCLVVKQSNFSADILDPKNVPRYRDYKVAVFYTENDFAICQRESQEAAIWYSRLGFDLTFAEFGDKGHERTPSLAAAFFARDCGAEASTPPLELASLRVKERPVLDRTDGKVNGVEPVTQEQPPDAEAASTPAPQARPSSANKSVVASAAGSPHQDKPISGSSHASSGQSAKPVAQGFSRSRPVDTVQPLRTRPLVPQNRAPDPPRLTQPHHPKPRSKPAGPVQVRLSTTIGIAPLMVSYSAALPEKLRRKSYFLWTSNGEPVSNGLNGQIFLTKPGEHEIKVLVTTEDGLEYSASRKVTVLERIIGKRSRQ